MMSKVRREEQHASIREEIKNAARRLMEQEGTAGISIRGIGRAMDLTAPALYHYYASRDALITDLIVDAFNALADELEKRRELAGVLPVQDQLMEVLLAYREWALAHPVDFQLIYGNPIPGYHAPEDVTVPAANRGLLVIAGLISRSLETGRSTPHSEYSVIPPEMSGLMTELARQLYTPEQRLLPLGLYLTSVGWPRIHGIIMLELFNHIQPVVGDVDAFYRIQLEEMVEAMGLKAK
jgi:AcrR family transcriptional regulator